MASNFTSPACDACCVACRRLNGVIKASSAAVEMMSWSLNARVEVNLFPIANFSYCAWQYPRLFKPLAPSAKKKGKNGKREQKRLFAPFCHFCPFSSLFAFFDSRFTRPFTQLKNRGVNNRPHGRDRGHSFFYFSRFNLTILPTAIHSSTYRLPCLSQQTPCGETKTPSSHCSRGSLLVARFLGSTWSPRWVINLLSLSRIVTRPPRSPMTRSVPRM